MGYDAYVRCNCSQDGLAKPPPFAVVWDENDGLYMPAPVLGEPTDELLQEVFDWQNTACVHPHMHLLDKRVGNIGAMAALCAAVEAVHPENVQTLARILPTVNGGYVTVEDNPVVLHDLDRFQTLVEGLPLVVLKDGETGRELGSTFPGREAVFVHAPGEEVELGLDEQGVFVRQSGKKTFQGTHVRQHLAPGRRPFRLENLETGAVLQGVPMLDLGLQTPALLVVSSGHVPSSEYAGIVGTLRELFMTSTGVGNPVYWA